LVRYKDKEQTVDLNTTSNADIADGIMDLMETVIDDYDFCLAN